MRFFRYWLWIGLLGMASLAAQDNDILIDHDLYHYIDRLDIKRLTGDYIHTDIKPYGRRRLAQIFAATDTNRLTPLEYRWHQRMRILADDDLAQNQPPKGLWGLFYRNTRDFLAVNTPALQLFANPVARLGAGIENSNYPSRIEDWQPLFQNTRGAVIRGSMFGVLGFYTEVSDNVHRVPQFVYDRYQQTQVLPGETFVKEGGQDNGLDFFVARAYLTISPIKDHLRIKFGRDRMFWGNGFQSMILSSHAPDYLMLHIQASIWKLEYTSLFTEMIDYIPGKRDDAGTHPRKYSVFHQLTFHPNPGLAISVFESVVYSPWLANGRRGFELQYLNPIIFYRSAEQALGSPDNAFLGLQLKVNLWRHFQLYGQFGLDDFNVSQFQQGRGYWGNKFGYQAGMKYIDAFGLPTLDLQLEYNQVRPYTYQHFNVSANFSHYYQSLGFGPGANAQGIFAAVRYHPFPPLNILLSYRWFNQGLDQQQPDGSLPNFGGDINRPYVERIQEFGNTVGQGEAFEVQELLGRVSYQLGKADAWIDLEGRFRRENDLSSLGVMLGLRASVAPAMLRY